MTEHRASDDSSGLQTALGEFVVNDYPYYDPETHGLDGASMLNALKAAPARSIVLLHACCHNPTGVDPSREERNIDYVYEAIAESLLSEWLFIRHLRNEPGHN